LNSNLTVNSKEYWDKRFASGDWEEKGGNHQTHYFYELLYTLLPEHLKEKFNDPEKQYSIADIGCAEGDGSKFLATKFFNTKVSGIDIAEAAIKKAKTLYPEINFSAKLNKQYDIVVSSNVLEHFKDPFEHMNELFEHSQKYVVILVPFEEQERIEEHFYTFLYKDFQLQFKNFNLIHLHSVKANKNVWNGKQHLFIYQKNADYHQISLETFGLGKMINNIESELETVAQELKTTKQALQTLRQKQENEFRELQNQYNLLNTELYTIKQSTIWKLATKYYAMRDTTPFIKRSIDFLKRYKISDTDNSITDHENNKKHKRQLTDILKGHPDQIIMILPPLVDWNIPLFQRPQHLARNIAKQNLLYFFSTPNGLYDNIDGFEEVSPGCYITNRFDLIDQLEEKKKVYDLSSTDNGTDWSFVKTRLDRGDQIIYQYIDEISEEISGHEIPKSLFEKHFNILKDERCIVIPSATKLEDDVKEHRTKNYKLVTNGVEIEHFSQTITKEQYPTLVKDLLKKNKPIIGYFGAFANWFDYELVIKLATERPDLEVLLLGVDYDGSIKKYNLEAYDNITIAGPINYKELPQYAAAFSVSTIPFLINDITESTSPIKLFEYMAMKKPIVTTDMPECRKYDSVLIGKDHNEFIQKINQALKLENDKNHIELLGKEALENSWKAKAMDIVEMIENNESEN